MASSVSVGVWCFFSLCTDQDASIQCKTAARSRLHRLGTAFVSGCPCAKRVSRNAYGEPSKYAIAGFFSGRYLAAGFPRKVDETDVFDPQSEAQYNVRLPTVAVTCSDSFSY